MSTSANREPWPESLSRLQGREVRHFRERLGLTPAEVVAQLSPLGIEMSRSTYVNFELGRRKSVTVPEILALGVVLRVPPIVLMVPLGRTEPLEIVKGRRVNSWTAHKWVVGGGPLLDAEQQEQREEGSQEDQEFEDYMHSQSELSPWGYIDMLQLQTLVAWKKGNETECRQFAQQLIAWREKIREAGRIPPPLRSDTMGVLSALGLVDG